MTTLLLHVCQYRRRKAQGYKQLQRGASGAQVLAAGGSGRCNQPGLTAYAHYFASSRVARSRYTPALASDLPSPVMSTADTQTAPCCLDRHQRHQQQQQLGSVSRSYSDPNLPGRCAKRQGASSAQQLASAATADDSAASAVAAVSATVATFSISPAPEEQAAGLVSFRHSCDCLLDLDDCDGGSVAAAGSPPLPPPPPPPTPATQLTLRKVASCSTAVKERVKKRVQFADEVGRKLLHVRVFSEPSCAPPMLSIVPRRDFAAEDADEEAGGQAAGRFKCQFAQPSSKYILFRENVQKNCLSLSNLYFDELTAKGSVAVKNVDFNKRVFVRVSFDQWVTSQDVEATYASSQDARQDTFVFSFPCPTGSCERGFEFCVCYEAAGQAFWDSNGGANYKVAARKPKTAQTVDAYTSDYKPNFNGVADFTEFSVWDHFSDRVYY